MWVSGTQDAGSIPAGLKMSMIYGTPMFQLSKLSTVKNGICIASLIMHLEVL
jgi:hypothetical protein